MLANRDGADTLKNVEFLQLKDAIYDVVNRSGELIDRIQLPASRQIVGFGKGGVVYMLARDASGSWIERTHR